MHSEHTRELNEPRVENGSVGSVRRDGWLMIFMELGMCVALACENAFLGVLSGLNLGVCEIGLYELTGFRCM